MAMRPYGVLKPQEMEITVVCHPELDSGWRSDCTQAGRSYL